MYDVSFEVDLLHAYCVEYFMVYARVDKFITLLIIMENLCGKLRGREILFFIVLRRTKNTTT